MTTVVDWRDKAYDVLIDRSTPFGNPFPMSSTCTREQSIQKHKAWLDEWIQNKKEIIIGCPCHGVSNKWVIEHLNELQGLTIACWCKPLDCHGDTLAELADEVDGEKSEERK